MKSAYLIGASREDLESVGASWRAMPNVASFDDGMQWHDSGWLFNVSTREDEFQESDWRGGWRDSTSVDADPPEQGVAWYIECRSEEVFARIIREAARLAPGRLWVLDTSTVVWPAEAVDPERLVL